MEISFTKWLCEFPPLLSKAEEEIAMTAQPQEKYEVIFWSPDRDPNTGEGYFRRSGHRNFESFVQADNWAWASWRTGIAIGTAIFQEGKVIQLYGVNCIDLEN